MTYLAHKNENVSQTVKDHLLNTAELARDNALEPFKSLAYECGLLHDVGKYTELFQKRINGEPIRCEHAICGAQWIKKNWENHPFSVLMEYCIAGHHTGLPDGGSAVDKNGESPSLHARLKSETGDFSAFENEITPMRPETAQLVSEFDKLKSFDDGMEKYAFFTRYVFSCLTDADFIDTERTLSPEIERGISGDFKAALEKLNDKLASFEPDTKVKAARKRLLDRAIKNAEELDEINILNMPTGSGKTLCSMKIALEYALKMKKKRIIYVIPYTSIIEQTANEFTSIFGDDLYVLQHHSNYDYENNYDSRADFSAKDKRKLSCENWDAPLILTTSVQLFQSLYHNKSSRLRKLHNMADSIIVFDEVHLMPIEYLQPCLRGIGYVTRYLNSNAIFLSATMPDYSPLLNEFLSGCTVKELIDDKSDFSEFSNCSYENLGKRSFDEIVTKAAEYTSSLIIVNRKKSAQEIYQKLSGKKFHLSTYMMPLHRLEIIGKIKEALKNNERITVVSTSLVEAGVDLDFETVFREIAGLDNILQSGGRCNREGMRDKGSVFVFESEDGVPKKLNVRVVPARRILDSGKDPCSQEAVEGYYKELFKFNKDKINACSISHFDHKDHKKLDSIEFKAFAESFKYISDDTIGVVVDMDDKSHELVKQLDSGKLSAKRGLQTYSVSLRMSEVKKMLESGLIENHGGALVLTNNDYYDKEMGIMANTIDSDAADYFD